MRPIRFLFSAGLALLLAACASTGVDTVLTEPPPADTGASVGAYRIGVDDIVQVTVWRNPELGITVPVRPDGMISVPLVGDVRAGGRTPDEVAQDIQSKLADFVRDPQVAVIQRPAQPRIPVARASDRGRTAAHFHPASAGHDRA